MKLPIQNIRILIIEDDLAVARSLRDGLTREGYTIYHCDSGKEGVEKIKKIQPHLIILDIRLPDGLGFDFCRQIRQAGMYQPILILTVRDEPIDKVLALEIGADDYMTKPYNPSELNARIRALLRRAYGEFASSESKLIFVDDLVVDMLKATVSRDHALINLTPTEYRLFVYMAQHPGQVFSRTQLINAIRDCDAEEINDGQTITVYMRRLREKLEYDPAHPRLILTVPGLGYRLVAGSIQY
ncbi:MAG TPA: DNA-binding response regulator [Anaerolineaceae bacterium]|nr:DNA-binding response regulator [Anaerolineaceae bacterium]